MADMLTFNGVPIATYGLTGFLLVFLTGATFMNMPSNSEPSVAAVATASLPAFIGNMLTPSAPPMDQLQESGRSAVESGRSAVESLQESGRSAVESLQESGISAVESLQESGRSAVESLQESGASAMETINKSAAETLQQSVSENTPGYYEDEEQLKGPSGGRKKNKNKNKKTRKSKH
jgi:hypothetical protein